MFPDRKQQRGKGGGDNSGNTNNVRVLLLLLAIVLSVILWLHMEDPEVALQKRKAAAAHRRCKGKRVYVYDLPAKFNHDLVENCHLGEYCDSLTNGGFGAPFAQAESQALGSTAGWWATPAHALEVILHRRMEAHLCRVEDVEAANLFYVPFYPAIDFEHKLRKNAPKDEVDALSMQLTTWLQQQPTFVRYGGRDHFLALGSPTWSFRRLDRINDTWGSKLEYIPEFKNMYKLEVERHPWSPGFSMGVPYPVGFHPVTDEDVQTWQQLVRGSTRDVRWSYVAPGHSGPGEGDAVHETRKILIKQCSEDARGCTFVNCSETSSCSPQQIMGLYQRSVFSVQTKGSSFTTAAVFESILGGAIPVFLWKDTAYTQYNWHFPKNEEDYSVYIPFDDLPSWTTIQAKLAQISESQIKKMQQKILTIIPQILYNDPTQWSNKVKDAADVALDGLAAVWREAKKELTPIPVTLHPGPRDAETKDEASTDKQASVSGGLVESEEKSGGELESTEKETKGVVEGNNESLVEGHSESGGGDETPQSRLSTLSGNEQAEEGALPDNRPTDQSQINGSGEQDGEKAEKEVDVSRSFETERKESMGIHVEKVADTVTSEGGKEVLGEGQGGDESRKEGNSTEQLESTGEEAAKEHSEDGPKDRESLGVDESKGKEGEEGLDAGGKPMGISEEKTEEGREDGVSKRAVDKGMALTKEEDKTGEDKDETEELGKAAKGEADGGEVDVEQKVDEVMDGGIGGKDIRKGDGSDSEGEQALSVEEGDSGVKNDQENEGINKDPETTTKDGDEESKDMVRRRVRGETDESSSSEETASEPARNVEVEEQVRKIAHARAEKSLRKARKMGKISQDLRLPSEGRRRIDSSRALEGRDGRHRRDSKTISEAEEGGEQRWSSSQLRNGRLSRTGRRRTNKVVESLGVRGRRRRQSSMEQEG
eukprot:TRINITY_DN6031_c0_g1_i1.p1 TRINITY_DN6031_c0_g1~~TRINITY_DN6031_c0_g1_i1.p1  ORF type:complete len:938 (+),score=202.77 TRINITY_DN6031_c0_g1_i1:781-3594(+)